MGFIEIVKNKLLNYGFKIYQEYEVDNSYVLMIDNSIINIEKENKLIISFQVTTKPDEAGNTILILKEINELKKIEIGVSFIFNNEDELIQGDEAFEFLNECISQKEYKRVKNETMINKLFYSLHESDFIKC